MIGDKVDDDLQTSFVRPFHKQFELVNALVWILRKVWVNIIIVANGIRAACFAFHDIRIVLLDAKCRVIGLACMLNDTCVPDMCTAKCLDLLQSLGCKVLHSAAPVLLLRAERNWRLLVCTKQAGEDLINCH